MISSDGGVIGTIYIIHFLRPLKHAQHYVGWTSKRFSTRAKRHVSGNGSALMRAVTAAGIEWVLAKKFRGTRANERKLKNRGSAKRYCPICRAEH